MNSRKFYRESSEHNNQSTRRRSVFAAMVTSFFLAWAGTIQAEERPGRLHTETGTASLATCQDGLRLRQSPIAPRAIESIEEIAAIGERGEHSLYFLHRSGRGLPVLAPAGGRIYRLDAVTTYSGGREHFFYTVYVEPCDGARFAVHHIDMLHEDLQGPLKNIRKEDCKYVGSGGDTVVCSARIRKTLSITSGDLLGYSTGGLVGLDLAHEDSGLNQRIGKRGLLSVFAEPLRAALKQRLVAGDRRPAGECRGEECRLVQGAWTNQSSGRP